MGNGAELRPGDRLGDFILEVPLGQGGMGQVWRAHQQRLNRKVAIKVLLRRYAEDPEFTARFKQEAHAAARFDHPNVVSIYDADEYHGHLYLVMQLLDGLDAQVY